MKTHRLVVGLLAVGALLAAGITAADAPPLHYQKEASGVYDLKTTLHWVHGAEGADDAGIGGTPLSWSAAATSCAKRANGPWRVPTVKELATLLDISVPSGSSLAMIDQMYFTGAPAQRFWSSTQLQGADAGKQAWYINFKSPAVASYTDESALNYVRCVK